MPGNRHLNKFFDMCWQNSETKGFHERFRTAQKVFDYLVVTNAPPELIEDVRADLQRQQLNEHFIKTSLIGTEVSEAIEALRNPNWAPHKTYYKIDGAFVEGDRLTDEQRATNKPEGFGSELADIVIRAGDVAVEAKIDLAEEIYWKMQYNATRSARHGNKRA